MKGTDLETGLPCDLDPVTAHIRTMHGTFQPDVVPPATEIPAATEIPTATEIPGKVETGVEGGTGIQWPSPGSDVLSTVKKK